MKNKVRIRVQRLNLKMNCKFWILHYKIEKIICYFYLLSGYSWINFLNVIILTFQKNDDGSMEMRRFKPQNEMYWTCKNLVP